MQKFKLSDRSHMEYYPNAVEATDHEFEEIWRFGVENVPPTPNPSNAKTNILRLQATFGAEYKFGRQTSKRVGGDCPDEWPSLVRRALEDARERDDRAETLKSVHVNWYPNGKAGVARHDDKDGPFVPDAPIYSYTFLSDPALPRTFLVYEKRFGKEPVRELAPADGSLLIMCGKMQTEFEHAVKPTAARKYANARRVNMTVRHLRPTISRS